MYRLTIDCLKGEKQKQAYSSVLTFVDLAGSEKASIHEGAPRSISPFGSRSEAGERVREGQHINRSLFFLTQVINQKASQTDDMHIPYRNSPLTKILKGSLGGNSRTAIILCITPCMRQYEQTQSTLRFGQNAKKVKNQVSQNFESIEKQENLLRNVLKAYEDKMHCNQESTEKMQMLISNLETEKRALNQRLREANVMKIEAAAHYAPQLGDPQLDEAYEYCMLGVGVIESSTSIHRYF